MKLNTFKSPKFLIINSLLASCIEKNTVRKKIRNYFYFKKAGKL